MKTIMQLKPGDFLWFYRGGTIYQCDIQEIRRPISDDYLNHLVFGSHASFHSWHLRASSKRHFETNPYYQVNPQLYAHTSVMGLMQHVIKEKLKLKSFCLADGHGYVFTSGNIHLITRKIHETFTKMHSK